MKKPSPNFFSTGVNHRLGAKRNQGAAGLPKRQKVGVKVSVETHKAITNLAERKGLSVSDLIRQEIKKGAA